MQNISKIGGPVLELQPWEAAALILVHCCVSPWIGALKTRGGVARRYIEVCTKFQNSRIRNGRLAGGKSAQMRRSITS